MSFWPRVCPVCRRELPARGNRRVRLPWRPGWSLVHAGACAEAVDAQQVLELAPVAAPALELVQLVRFRRYAQQRCQAVQLPDYPLERLVAVARSVVAPQRQPLVSEVGEQRLKRRGEDLFELVRALALHGSEVSRPVRTVRA